MLAGALVATLSLGGSVARAGGTMEQAKGWFQEGDKAEEGGDCTTAIQKFRLALAVKETPQLYLRIGRCQDKLGTSSDALDTYRKARSLAEGNDKVASVIDDLIASLKPRVPRVIISAPNAPDSLVVSIGSVALSSLSVDHYANPGDVVVTAKANGFRPFTAKLRLEPGDQRTVTINLTPIAKDAPPPPVDDRASGPHPASIAVLAVGVVGLGVGIGLTVHGFGLKSDLENDSKFGCHVPVGQTSYKCTNATFDGKNATAVQSQSNTFQAAGIGTLVAGGAVAIVGGVLMGVTWHSKASVSASKTEPTSARISVLPIVSPGQGGLLIDGRF